MRINIISNTLLTMVTVGLLLSPLQNIRAAEDETIMVVLEQDLAAYWKADKSRPVEYPAGAMLNSQQGCAAVGFIIEKDGTTSSHQVLVSAPPGVFDKTALRASRKLTYKRTEQNDSDYAVFTSRTFTFTLKADEDPENGSDGQASLAELCLNAANEKLGSLGG